MATHEENVPADTRRESVAEYYGSTLQSTQDLKTSACCPIDSVPEAHRPILAKIHPEVRDRFYGCGSPIPDALKGATVLDLGCGTGRDVYLASSLVGAEGAVIGVDMTDAQLEVAKRHVQFHADALLDGKPSNVTFRKGVIEDLAAAGIADQSVDVVISNCVCNLSPDKPAVFREIARVLREGGELYFSDVYTDRRLSPEAQKDEELVGECLGGALYIHDFRRIMADAGMSDVRVVSSGPIVLHDERMLKLVPDVRFYSITIRAFKVSGLADRPEDYGQTATYTGCCSSGQKFDARFHFPKDVPVPVDANTAAVLQKSRYSKRFSVSEPGPHKGLFDEQLDGGSFTAAVFGKKASTNGGKTGSDCSPAVNGKEEAANGCLPAAGAKKSGGGCC